MAYVKLDKELANAVKNTLTEINEEISLCFSSVSSSFSNKKINTNSSFLTIYDEDGELIADYRGNAANFNSAAEKGRSRALIIRNSVTAKVNKVITALNSVISLVDNFESQTGISLEAELGADLSSAFQFLSSYGNASSLSSLRGNGIFGNSSLNGIYSFDESLLEYDELSIWSSFGGFLEEQENESELETSIREFFVGKLQGYMDEDGNIVIDGQKMGSLNSLSMATLLQTDAGQQMKAEFETEYKDQITSMLFGGGVSQPGMVPFESGDEQLVSAGVSALAFTSLLSQIGQADKPGSSKQNDQDTNDGKKPVESTEVVDAVKQYVEEYGHLIEGEQFDVLRSIIENCDAEITDAQLAIAMQEAGLDVETISLEVTESIEVLNSENLSGESGEHVVSDEHGVIFDDNENMEEAVQLEEKGNDVELTDDVDEGFDFSENKVDDNIIDESTADSVIDILEGDENGSDPDLVIDGDIIADESLSVEDDVLQHDDSKEFAFDENIDLDIDTNGDGKPILNIETDEDGIPDVNIDTNGDGKPTLNIETDEEAFGDDSNSADVNIDTDANGAPEGSENETIKATDDKESGSLDSSTSTNQQNNSGEIKQEAYLQLEVKHNSSFSVANSVVEAPPQINPTSPGPVNSSQSVSSGGSSQNTSLSGDGASKPNINNVLPDIPTMEKKVDEVIQTDTPVDTGDKKVNSSSVIAGAGAAAATTTVIGGGSTPAPNVQVSSPVLPNATVPGSIDMNMAPVSVPNSTITTIQSPGIINSGSAGSSGIAGPSISGSSQIDASFGSGNSNVSPNVESSGGEVSGKSYGSTIPSDSSSNKSGHSNSFEPKKGVEQHFDANKFDGKLNVEGQDGVLGDSSYAEMIVKTEKEIKIATGITAGSMLFALALKLTNVIGLLSFVLVIGAIGLVYATFRVKKGNVRKKIQNNKVNNLNTKDSSENVIYEEEVVYVDEDGNVIEFTEGATIVSEEIIEDSSEDMTSTGNKEFQSAEDVIKEELEKENNK
jgi:hypothetical protein